MIEEQETKQRRVHSLIPGEDDPISESDLPIHEKRTRFSLSHDQDSIGKLFAVYYIQIRKKFVYFLGGICYGTGSY